MKNKKHLRSLRQSGNAIVMLFAAIGMAGVVTYGLNNVMRGPAVTAAEVSRRTIAENNLVATTRLAIASATRQQVNGGDCDGDGFVEPVPFRDAGSLPAPVGGGLIPSSVGASLTDPWGGQYGYCVWDPGTASVSDAVADCGGATPRRLEGAPRDDQYAIAVISAGKNGVFETTCNAFADADADNAPDTTMLDKPAGSDDVVLAYSYAEANGIGGGEWMLNPGNANMAQIGKNIEVGNASNPRGATFGQGLELRGARGLILPRDPGDNSVTGACTADKENQLRLNIGDGSEVPLLEICYANAWETVSGGTQVGTGGACPIEAWVDRDATTPDWMNAHSVAYGNGIFVAVGHGNAVKTSPDGITWTARTGVGGGAEWQAVAFGNGIFAAISWAGTHRVMTSTDGITWTARAAEANGWENIIYGGGQFVAVASSGTNRVMTSPDGITWTPRTAPAGDSFWGGLVYANNQYMAGRFGMGGGSSFPVMTSPDGITWTGSDPGWPGMRGSGIAYGNGIYVSVQNTTMTTSTDGTTWTEVPSLPSGVSLARVFFAGGRFVAIGYGGSNRVIISEDGLNWTPQTLPVDANWLGFAYNGERYVVAAMDGSLITAECPDTGAGGGGGNTAACTGSGAGEWTSAGPTTLGWAGLTVSSNGSKILASGGGGYDPGGGVWVSNNGGASFARIDGSDNFNDVNSAMSRDGNRMIWGEYNNGSIPLRYSTNGGASFANSNTGNGEYWNGMSMSANGMVALATIHSSATFRRSTDGGATWTNTTASAGIGGASEAAISADGTHAVIAYDNRIDVSTDGGATWTNARYNGSELYDSAAISADGEIILVGHENGRLLVSRNGGTSWAPLSGVPVGDWSGVAMSDDGSAMLAGGDQGLYYSSDSGATWIHQSDVTGHIWSVSMSGDGGKLAAGGDGTPVWTRTCAGAGGGSTDDAFSLLTPHPLDDGLIAHWPMDEGTGTVVADEIGDSDGTIVNTPAWSSDGPIGDSSLTFDRNDADGGEGDGVLVNTDFERMPVGTISLWANIEEVDSSGSELFTLADYIILRHEAGTLRMWALANGLPASGREVNLIGTGWHHIVATFDATEGIFRLYVDGVLVDEATPGGPIPVTTSHSITKFGNHVNLSGFDLQGGIDDVRLYDRALGPGEIAQLSKRSAGQSTIRGKVASSVGPSLSDKISASHLGSHACTVKDDGTAWCWGAHWSGQLGNGQVHNQFSEVPVKVKPPGIHSFASISAGDYHTCGVTAEGSGWCWGQDTNGCLGNGSTITDYQYTPSPVSGGPWNKIVAGGYFSCGIAATGRLYCWGQDSDQQLGNGSGTTAQHSPVVVGTNLYRDVSVGANHACAIRNNGLGYCWGRGADGRLGTGDNTTRNVPTAIHGNHEWKKLAPGVNDTCGVTTAGALFCWGDDYNGSIPKRMDALNNWTDVKFGSSHACATRADGTLWCWGLDDYGQLGNDQVSGWQPLPVRVNLPAKVTGFSAGFDVTCALTDDKAVWCWGDDYEGMLGNGDALGNQDLPGRVVNMSTPSPWIWNTGADAFQLNSGMTIALGNKWLSDDGSAQFFGFESAGKAHLVQNASPNQLLVETSAAIGSAQTSFGRAEPVNVPADDTTGLFAEWLFDETSGTTAADTVGGYNGTVSGTTSWNTTGGRTFAGVLEFDGSTGRVTVANNAIFRPGTTMTAMASMWVRPDGIQPHGTTVLEKTYTNGTFMSYGLRFVNGNHIAFQTTSILDTVVELVSREPLRANAWSKIDIILTPNPDNTGEVLKYLYVNGVLQGRAAVGHLIHDTNATTGRLYFGAGGCAAPCRAFRGAIDDVRMRGSLTPEEALAAVTATWENETTHVLPKTIGSDFGTDNLEVATNNSDASDGLDSLTPTFSLTTSGEIGIGEESPNAKIDVAGSVRVGYEPVCTASNEGALRYTGNVADVPSTDTCTASNWAVTAANPPGGCSLNNIIYGGGRFVVACANGNMVASTADGSAWDYNTWTGSPSGVEATAYGNGTYVFVGPDVVFTSPDAYTLTRRAISGSMLSVAFGNGTFVAVGSNGAKSYSTDNGATWTSLPVLEYQTINSITYGGGQFVAVASNGTNRVMTSPDGINWTPHTAAAASTWWSVTYGNGIYVAVSQAGLVMTSPDGVTWTSRTAAAANMWTGVTYGAGYFVAVAQDGTNRIMTSPNGITWTARAAPGSMNWLSVAYGGGRFMGIAAWGSETAMVSSCTQSSAGSSGLPSGAIGYWKFDETSGTTAADSAGTNPGTLIGNASFTTGKKGNAVTLDGTGDYVDMGSAANLDNLGAVSACAWVNLPDPFSGAPMMIIGKGANSGYDGWGSWATESSPNSLAFGMQGGHDNMVQKYDLFTIDNWVHTCGVWDGSSAIGGHRIYVNGVRALPPYDDTVDFNTGLQDDAANNLIVGASHAGGLTAYGTIDEVVLYSRALDDAEVQQVMNATAGTSSPAIPSGLVGYWNFDETSGTVAADSAGTNPGTLMGNATFVPGRRGNAISLDGNGDFVTMGSAASLDDLPQITSCAWVNGPATQPNSYFQIVGKAGSTGDNGFQIFGAGGTGNYTFGAQGRGNPNVYVQKSNTVPENSWQHLCMVWDGGTTSASVKPYLNGVEITAPWEYTGSGSTASDASYNLVVGNSHTGTVNEYLGLIDEVTLFNRALSAAEINDVMNATDSSGAGLGGVAEEFQYCDGTDWQPFTGGVGATYWKRGTKYVSAGHGGACGVTSEGVAKCWGLNLNGQLGIGSNTDSHVPADLTDSANWKMVSINADNGCGVKLGGTGWCWGAANSGKLGNGTTTPAVNAPVTLSGGGTWTMIRPGYSSHTCGLQTSGRAYCWGNPGSGRLGNGTTSGNRTSPTEVHNATTTPGFADWISISPGFDHTCGVRANGTAWCWGESSSGQLGDNNSSTDRTRPVQVGTSGTSTLFTDWVDISAGNEFTCGIRANGTAWCWGTASDGRLGNGTTSPDTNIPVQVGTSGTSTLFTDWVSISAGYAQTCGVRANGTAWCWGDTTNGQVGNGTITPDVSVPNQVQTDTGPGGWSDWMAVDTGRNLTCGNRSDGSLWCWGGGQNGGLGNNTTSSSQRPVRAN